MSFYDSRSQRFTLLSHGNSVTVLIITSIWNATNLNAVYYLTQHPPIGSTHWLHSTHYFTHWHPPIHQLVCSEHVNRRDKFSKSAHESAHGTPPQTRQCQNNAHLTISIIYSAPQSSSRHPYRMHFQGHLVFLPLSPLIPLYGLETIFSPLLSCTKWGHNL